MIERKMSTTIQFTESQLNWLQNKSDKLTLQENRKVSKSEITRNAVQSLIESEK